jgi:hypothetical protein
MLTYVAGRPVSFNFWRSGEVQPVYPAKIISDRDFVAYGASKLLEFFLEQNPQFPFKYCIDLKSEKDHIAGLPVHRTLDAARDRFVVVFAVSSEGLQQIFATLVRNGMRYKRDFILYSDLMFDGFAAKLKKEFQIDSDQESLERISGLVLNTLKPHHTTILGTLMISDLLSSVQAKGIPGDVLEVGAYEGGNALSLITAGAVPPDRMYFIMDSFEGFPDLSSNDPTSKQKGDYKTAALYEEIFDKFAIHSRVSVVKGFVPDSFARLPARSTFCLSFYDCDLYQPAKDTFAYAWERTSAGGYMVVHDYFAGKGGYTGVKTATTEFFGNRADGKLVEFYENTCAVIQKISN